jgi:hypothetical protein
LGTCCYRYSVVIVYGACNVISHVLCFVLLH